MVKACLGMQFVIIVVGRMLRTKGGVYRRFSGAGLPDFAGIRLLCGIE